MRSLNMLYSSKNAAKHLTNKKSVKKICKPKHVEKHWQEYLCFCISVGVDAIFFFLRQNQTSSKDNPQ